MRPTRRRVRFHATCRKGYWPNGKPPRGSTARPEQCDVLFDDPAAFAVHMTTRHPGYAIKLHRPLTIRLWRPPKPTKTLFAPEPFGIGDWVTWEAKGGVHTGQVWALVRGRPKERWVADGAQYHLVHEAQLVKRAATTTTRRRAVA